LRIAEPMTVLTDVLLGLVALTLGVRLWRAARSQDRRGGSPGADPMWDHPLPLWAAGFLASAAAALLGAAAHGAGDFHVTLHDLTWPASLVAVAAAGGLLTAAIVVATLPQPWQRPVLGLLALKATAVTLLVLRQPEFRTVALDYGASLVFVLGLVVVSGRGGARPEGRWIVAGVLAAFGAVAVQRAGPDLHPYFNHNDLYHLIQAGAFYLLYRGGLLLEPRPVLKD